MKRGILYNEYLVKGERIKYLLGYLENKSVPIYSFKEIDDKNVKVLIDCVDSRKFFAICKNMCYNIKKVKYKGWLSPLVIALKNLGLVIGALSFLFAVHFLNDCILKIECVGSGSCFTNEIIAVCKDYGVDKFKSFSKADLVGLKHELLSSNEEISFVSIQKSGNRLIINSILQNGESETLNKQTKDLVSPIKGVVEYINVLRGTPIVNVGDTVDIGSVLIGAYLTGKEDKTYPTYIVGRVSILEEKSNFYKLEYIDDEVLKTVENIAKFSQDDEVVSIKSTVKDGGIEVVLTVRRIVIGG